MKVMRAERGGEIEFILADVAPAYVAAVQGLGYAARGDTFVRAFPADSAHVDRAFDNFARHAETLVLQKAGVLPRPWERGLSAFLERVAGAGVDWWLVGSAALAVRGIAVEPGDLDLVADGPGANRLGDLLLDALIEPVARTEDWVVEWFGRAFLHCCLDWVGAVKAGADEPEPCDFGPVAARRREVVVWRGHPLQVPPLDLQLAVSRRRGLSDRVALIEVFLRDRNQSPQ
jgi:hypothetical protein